MPFDFRAVVLIGEPEMPDTEALVEGALARFPGLGTVTIEDLRPMDLTPFAHKLAASNARYANLAAEPEVPGLGIVLSVGGTPFNLMCVPFPHLHRRVLADAPIRNFDPAEALSAHLWHIIAMPTGPRADIAASRVQAGQLQALAAGILEAAGGTAVLWEASQGFQAPQDARRAAERAAAGGLPMADWVQFFPLAEGENGAARCGMMTLGLKPFLGREIELEPGPYDEAAAGARVYGLAAALLGGQTAPAEGTILPAAGGTPDLRVHIAAEGWRRGAHGLPALVLLPPDSDLGEEAGPASGGSLLSRVFGRAG